MLPLLIHKMDATLLNSIIAHPVKKKVQQDGHEIIFHATKMINILLVTSLV